MSIGCVSHSFQKVSFFIIVFGLVMIFFTFPCLWEIRFSSGTVSWLLGLDRILSDHMIILAVRRRSKRELDRWSFGGGLF